MPESQAAAPAESEPDSADQPEDATAPEPKPAAPPKAEQSADGAKPAKAKAKKLAKTNQPAKAKPPSTRRKLNGFDLPERTVELLEGGDISTVSQFLKRLAEGEKSILAIKGLGPKALEEVMQTLKKAGYQLP
jgi:DNA-directed RNA polymerase alpha subunit